MRRIINYCFGGRVTPSTAADDTHELGLLSPQEQSTSAAGVSSNLRQPDNGNVGQVDQPDTSATSDINSEALEEFHQAVQFKEISYVENILTSLPSDEDRAKLVNAQDNCGQASLHFAAFRHNTPLANLLLEHGFDVNIRDNDDPTPLHRRAGFRCTIFDMLIGAGADVNAQGKNENSPLNEAVCGHIETAVACLLTFSNVEFNSPKEYGFSPLFWACTSPLNPNIVRLLLDAAWYRKDSMADLKTYEGRTPLHLAVKNNLPQLVTEILNHKVFTETELVRIDDKDDDGDTALHYACSRGRYEICVQLLNHGAVKCLDVKNSRRMRPVHIAARGGYYKICELFLSYQNNSSVNAEAFELVCESGNLEAVRWFVNNCTIELNEQPRKICASWWDTAPYSTNFEINCVFSKEDPAFFYQVIVKRLKKPKPNFLSRAIAKEHKQAAKYIVQDSPLWHNGLCNGVLRDGKLDTPMRDLIRTMPDIARQALNQCTDITDDVVRFKYEFVDDADSIWQPLWETWNGKEFNSSCVNSRPPFPTNNLTQSFGYSARCWVSDNTLYTTNPRVLQENHVIMLMVKYDRDDLLKHPLVSTLIGQKWRKFGRLAFMASFIGYLLYLMLLTTYSVTVAPVNSLFYLNQSTLQPLWTADACDNSSVSLPQNFDISNLDRTDVCRLIEDYQKPPHNCHMDLLNTDYSLHLVQLTLLVVSIAMLTAKLALMFVPHTFNDYLFCIVCALTVVVTSPWHGFNCFYEYGLLQSWSWQVACFNIMLAYVHLALKLEYAPGIGIYVHMLRNVSVTMLRVLVAPFGIVLGALALCFYMIFKASVRHDQHVTLLVPENDKQEHSGWPLNPFYSFPKAVLKTLVMLIGEYDMEIHFTANDLAIAPIVLILLVLFGTIAIMNLLVGLAIKDVSALQDDAEAQQLKMQITYALSMERLIRSTHLTRFSYFKNLVRSDYISFYNSDGVLLQQTETLYNEDDQELLAPDNDRSIKSTQSNTRKFLAWCYYDVLVGKRYSTNFHARLQEIASEKAKLAEEASQKTGGRGRPGKKNGDGRGKPG